MNAHMDSEPPTLHPAAHALKPNAADRSVRELPEQAMAAPGPNRHSDRVLAFLRKNPGRVEWFQ